MILELTLIEKIALFFVMTIGLPHGALDGAIALGLGYGKNFKKIFLFLSSYILLALLALALWKLSPAISLFFFLIYSLVHFGLGDIYEYKTALTKKYQLYLGVISHGGIAIIGIPYFNQESVYIFFSILAGENSIFVLDFLNNIFFLWITLSFIYIIISLKDHRYYLVIELLIMYLVITLLLPLISFAIYFCAIHSRKHFISLWKTLRNLVGKKIIFLTSTILTFSSWIFAVLFYKFQTNFFSSDESFLRMVFILLSILTIPHMILVDSIFRPIINKLKL